MQENKTNEMQSATSNEGAVQEQTKVHYLYVRGKKVEVSEEIYRAYVKPERKEKSRQRRMKGKICSVEFLSENGIDIEDTETDTLTSITEEEQSDIERKALAAAIAKLKERDRLIINLVVIEGRTQHEVAEILGIEDNSMSELYQRVLERFKKIYNFFLKKYED